MFLDKIDYVTPQKEIEILEQRISVLKEKIRRENRAKILPSLKEEGINIIYTEHGLKVQGNTEKMNDLVELMSNSHEIPGSYHFGVELSEKTSIRYDDGSITIHLNTNGALRSSYKQTMEELKLLGLKVSFDYKKNEIKHNIIKLNTQLVEVENLEKEINS